MIRLLLDMGIARSTGVFLNSLGHDAIHLIDEGLERLPDLRIVEKARLEGRVVVTHDPDFSRIVALSGRRIPSLITLRLGDMRPSSVNSALTVVLRETSDALVAGALVSVTDSGLRLRLLPVQG